MELYHDLKQAIDQNWRISGIGNKNNMYVRKHICKEC